MTSVVWSRIMKHRMSAWHKLAAAALSALLALNLAYPAVPAFAEEGDPAPASEEQAQQQTDIKAQSEETGSTSATPAEKVSVTVEVIGPDSAGSAYDWVKPVTMSAEKGANAWSVLKSALDQAGIAYNAHPTSYGIYIETISSPITGEALGYDAGTGNFWQFLVNGAAPDTGASGYALRDSDKITLSYSSSGSPDATKTDNTASYDEPNAEVTNLPSDWSQSEDNGNVTSATTPTTETSVNWKTRISGSNGAPVSEPLIVDGKVYLAIGENPSWASIKSDYAGKLVRIDTASGKVEATGDLASTIDYTVRPLYQGGIIYVPLSNGVVQAFNASTMKTRWVSSGTATSDQSSCSLRLENGTLYVGTAAYGAEYTYVSGALSALDAATGRTQWSATNSSAGYYWTAPLCNNRHVYIGDTAGTMHVFDAATGKEESALALGSSVNADPVLYKGSLLVVTRDGALHRLTINSDGSLSAASRLAALGSAKAAPTVVGNTALIAGSTAGDGRGALVLVNLDTMTVTRTVNKADGKLFALYDTIATPPLVSIQDDGVWAYFARSNASDPSSDYSSYETGGDLYSYRLGDEEAHVLYAPDGTVAQYCDSPVIADAKGNLYYLNDSGYLVQLRAGEVKKDDSKPSSTTDTDSKPTSGNTAAAPTAKPNAASAATHQGGRPVTSHVGGNSASSANKPAETQQGSTAKSVAKETTAEPSAPDDAATTETAPETETARQIPIWPIIGILVGAILLIWLFASRRRKDEESK